MPEGVLTTAWTDAIDSRTNQYVRRWMRHFAALRATYIEAWLDDLADVTLPSLVRPLSATERDLLVEDRWRRDNAGPGCDPTELEELVLDLEALVLEAQADSPPGAAFVRLGSRAPLDSPLAIGGDLQVDGGPEALQVLQESARVFDDLCLAQECAHCPAIVVRPWLELEPEREARLELRGGVLVNVAPRRAETLDPEAGALARELVLGLRGRLPAEDLLLDVAIVDGAAKLLDVSPLV